MNYLAHARLSFGDPHLLIGNLISDFVKGTAQYRYPIAVQKGIRLHRAIDTFTDEHAAVKEIKSIFQQDYGRYAGAFADVSMDYFLANDEQEFSDENVLHQFVIETHQHLENSIELLPENFHPVFSSMKQHFWLFHFRNTAGMEKSFKNLVKRAKYLEESERAFLLFIQHEHSIRMLYQDFFPEVKKFSMKHISENML